VTGLAVPLDVADLTAEWFTSVLEGHARGTVVERVAVLDAHSGTTGRVRVALSFGREPTDLPQTVFVKLAPFDARQREFVRRTGLGVAEARLYATLGAELPVRVPRVWHADVSPDGAYVMVLEDLVASGCSFPRPSDPEVVERTRTTVTSLARLHARFWETPRFATDLSWVPERAGFGAEGGKRAAAATAAGAFVRRALDRFGDDMPPAFRRIGMLYVERTAEILDLWDEGERTLIHGDPHMGNLFVDREEVGFFDWAMVSRSPGMRDVAYFCCNSIPPEVRRAEERELVRRYCGALGSEGVDLAFDVAFEQYRLFAVYSWVSAASTAAVGERWQPEAVGRGGMARATAAVDELDAAGLLGARLGART
jgi:aminoglycoside phosphotransferase (APT) family kinase protein